MKRLFIAFSLFLTFGLFAQIPSQWLGNYSAYLQLNKDVQLPVRFSIEKNGDKNLIHIKNGKEDIVLVDEKWRADTLIIDFPNFDSQLQLVQKTSGALTGQWINRNKLSSYNIPFFATLNQIKLNKSNNYKKIAGRWETYFSEKPTIDDAGIMILQQKNDTIIGTVLTETGDYRFLEGRIMALTFTFLPSMEHMLFY